MSKKRSKSSKDIIEYGSTSGSTSGIDSSDSSSSTSHSSGQNKKTSSDKVHVSRPKEKRKSACSSKKKQHSTVKKKGNDNYINELTPWESAIKIYSSSDEEPDRISGPKSTVVQKSHHLLKGSKKSREVNQHSCESKDTSRRHKERGDESHRYPKRGDPHDNSFSVVTDKYSRQDRTPDQRYVRSDDRSSQRSESVEHLRFSDNIHSAGVEDRWQVQDGNTYHHRNASFGNINQPHDSGDSYRKDFYGRDKPYHARDKDMDRERRETVNRRMFESEPQKRKSNATLDSENIDAAPHDKKAKHSEDMSKAGGAYIPPAKLLMMQKNIIDKNSIEYQKMAWEALKKSLVGLINKVNTSNIIDIVTEVFQENIVRGRGLLSLAIIRAQTASPTFAHICAALVAIINTKFPQIGELILNRLILQFKRGFKRNDKIQCMSSTRFIGHLVNQQVAHELISLEILTLLLENPTDDSMEVAINFLKECGKMLKELSPKGMNAIITRMRGVLHEGQLGVRVQYMVEVMLAIIKDDFKDHPSIMSELDLVKEDDQFTHMLQLDEVTAGQELLNVFKADNDYLENEERYKMMKREILAEDTSAEEASGDESDSDDTSGDEDKDDNKLEISDQTETNLVHLRRTIYLTIQSSLDFEECAHKLLKANIKPGQEPELCYMILDSCAQQRTYEKFFGLLAQRFCQLNKTYLASFETIFHEQFETIHRLDNNKLRNVATLFSHLLHTDSISWAVISCMKLTEEDTSASRIFIKILFMELSEFMGLPKLNKRLKDPTLQQWFEGILPRNNPKNTRFAINFFTTIGLGGLTEDLREHLKGISKQMIQQRQKQEELNRENSSSSSNSSDSDSSDSDSSSSSSSSEMSDSEESDSSTDSDIKSRKKKSNVKKHKRDSPKHESKKKLDSGHDRKNNLKRAEKAKSTKNKQDRGHIEDKQLKQSLPQGTSLVRPDKFNSPTVESGRSAKGRDISSQNKTRCREEYSVGGRSDRNEHQVDRDGTHASEKKARHGQQCDYSDAQNVDHYSETDTRRRIYHMEHETSHIVPAVPTILPRFRGKQPEIFDPAKIIGPSGAFVRRDGQPHRGVQFSGYDCQDMSPISFAKRNRSNLSPNQSDRMYYNSPPRSIDHREIEEEIRRTFDDKDLEDLPIPRQFVQHMEEDHDMRRLNSCSPAPHDMRHRKFMSPHPMDRQVFGSPHRLMTRDYDIDRDSDLRYIAEVDRNTHRSRINVGTFPDRGRIIMEGDHRDIHSHRPLPQRNR